MVCGSNEALHYGGGLLASRTGCRERPDRGLELADVFSGATIGPEELAARLGYAPNQREAVTRWLRSHGVRYFIGRKGPWTTVQALQNALDGTSVDSTTRLRLPSGKTA